MKVELEIDKKYMEPEIHVCNHICDEETMQLKQAVCEFVDGNVVAYDGESSVLLRYADIVRIFSANKNVYVSTEERQYRIRERLYEMEERLDVKRYVRISNSEIINIQKLIKLDTSLTGTIKMYLKGNQETYVSRRYVSKIKKALGI